VIIVFIFEQLLVCKAVLLESSGIASSFLHSIQQHRHFFQMFKSQTWGQVLREDLRYCNSSCVFTWKENKALARVKKKDVLVARESFGCFVNNPFFFFFKLFQHFSFFPLINCSAHLLTLRVALLYLLCLWKVLASSSIRCSSSGSGSEGPAQQAMPANSAARWVTAWGACPSAPLRRRSWSGCHSSCSFMLCSLHKLSCPSLYLDFLLLPPLSALPFPKLTGGKIPPAQTQRKAESCQMITSSNCVGFQCCLSSSFFSFALPFNYW